MKKYKIIRDPEFYKKLLIVALPVSLQGILNWGIQATDSAMVGLLGQTELAGVALANQVNFLFYMFCYGLATGGAVLITQFWGKKDTVSAGKISSLLVLLIGIPSILFFAVCYIAPETILRIFSSETAVIEQGLKYLNVLCWTFIFFAFSTVYSCCIKAVGYIRVSTLITVFCFFANIILNYGLIFGVWGFPKMEIAGAAIATLTVRIIEFILLLLHNIFINNRAKITIRYMLSPRLRTIKNIFRVCIPVFLNELIRSLGNTALFMIYGRMGEKAVASISIVNIVIQLGQVTIMGLVVAGGLLIGNKVGSAQYNEAFNIAKTLMVLSIFIGIIAAVLILICGNLLLLFYNLPIETIKTTRATILSAMVVIFPVSVEFMRTLAILRSGGDVKFVLLLDGFSIWIIGVPLTIISGLLLNCPLWLVYLLSRLDSAVKAGIAFIRIRSGKWMINMTNETDT